MQPQSTKPSRKINLPRIRAPKIPTKVVGLVLLALAVIGIFFLGNRWYTHRTPSDNTYSYIYNQLSALKLPGDGAGSGMSLDKPVELQTTTIEEKSNQASLFHPLVVNNKPVISVEIAIASVRSTIGLQPEYLIDLNKAITDPNNINHDGLIKPLQQFVTQRISPNYTAIFAKPKVLLTPNIKANAWYITYALTAKEKTKPGLNFPDMEGQAIMAVGKSTVYYFKLDALKVNWQPNQKAWDQVINSLKIDQ